jgi:hypothetical protein
MNLDFVRLCSQRGGVWSRFVLGERADGLVVQGDKLFGYAGS